MDYKLIVPVLISFALSLLMGPVVIPFLRKLKMGQTERVEGVQSHLKKAGTPKMCIRDRWKAMLEKRNVYTL